MTKIQWTERTWNPVRGCSIVSPGCINCYAMKQAHRFSGEGKPYHGLTKLTGQGPQWTGVVHTVRSALTLPLKWRKPSRIFVNSMSDLFHEGVPESFIVDVFDIMALARRHTFQVLTKRPERMRTLLPRLAAVHTAQDGSGWPLPNVWLGVSCENQQTADERIPLLLETPAAVRFISAEPLLGPIDLFHVHMAERHYFKNALERSNLEPPHVPDAKLDWVIVGGESGPGARPTDLAWVRSIAEQCGQAGVACFVKQIGARPYASVSPDWSWNPNGVRDRKGGDPAEWPDDLRVREYPV